MGPPATAGGLCVWSGARDRRLTHQVTRLCLRQVLLSSRACSQDGRLLSPRPRVSVGSLVVGVRAPKISGLLPTH